MTNPQHRSASNHAPCISRGIGFNIVYAIAGALLLLGGEGRSAVAAVPTAAVEQRPERLPMQPTQHPPHMHGYIPDVVSGLTAEGPLAGTTPIDLVIGLPTRNTKELSALLRDLYDPASLRYQQYLTPREFAERFGPTAASYSKLLKFVKANKLTVVVAPPNRKLIQVRGTAALIDKAFHITLLQYRHPTEDRLFYAPDAEPTLDPQMPRLQITGLDSFRLPGRFSHDLYKTRKAPEPKYASGSGGNGLYTGHDFRAAYVPDTGLTGKGQAIGVLEFAGYAPSDIKAYETQYGMPDVPLQNVYLSGYSGGHNNEESAADIELVISMAPGISKLNIYGGIYDGAGVPAVLNEMANPTQGEPLPYQISTSYYFFYDQNIYDALMQLSVQGQALFVASGDFGSYNELTGAGDFPPADYPLVTSVGGTELQTSGPGGSWVSEAAAHFSGGGYSPWAAGDPHFAIPDWQSGIDFTLSQGSTSARNAPDVAMVADNILIYQDGAWHGFSGTSAAAPLWAGFMALVNEYAKTMGRPQIGFANPILYAIGKQGSSAIAFHDITTGENSNATNPGKYAAVVGYDLVTGWGSPNGNNLIGILVRPYPCKVHPEFCFGIFDPLWWLKCPACTTNIFINMGDNFRDAIVLDSLGNELGRFQHLQVPLFENGVSYNFRTTVKLRRGMGYVLRAQPAPGKEGEQRFSPAYIFRNIKAPSPTTRKSAAE